ncbi:MAG: substrate-binding domain-containing protein, partial [Microcella pacifica]
LAVRHLLDLGRRRIALLAGPLDIRQVADRVTGARRAIAEVSGSTLEIIAAPGLTVVDGRHGGEEVAARAAADRPDGIFAVNDLLAVGVLQALVMTGSLRVPDDIALVGYDDIDFASAAVVPLTSVRQPSQLIGSTAIDLLIEAAADPEQPSREVVFQPELVVRASTAG